MERSEILLGFTNMVLMLLTPNESAPTYPRGYHVVARGHHPNGPFAE